MVFEHKVFETDGIRKQMVLVFVYLLFWITSFFWFEYLYPGNADSNSPTPGNKSKGGVSNPTAGSSKGSWGADSSSSPTPGSINKGGGSRSTAGNSKGPRVVGSSSSPTAGDNNNKGGAAAPQQAATRAHEVQTAAPASPQPARGECRYGERCMRPQREMRGPRLDSDYESGSDGGGGGRGAVAAPQARGEMGMVGVTGALLAVRVWVLTLRRSGSWSGRGR